MMYFRTGCWEDSNHLLTCGCPFQVSNIILIPEYLREINLDPVIGTYSPYDPVDNYIKHGKGP